MRFVPTESVERLDLQALHRVRARLVRQRTAVINQIRAFLLERGIAVRQGHRFLRAALPDILAQATDLLSPRMIRMIADLPKNRNGPTARMRGRGLCRPNRSSNSICRPCTGCGRAWFASGPL